MYAAAAVGTYEKVLRAGDAGVYPVERRALHGVNSCDQCVSEAAKGWQPFGVLKDIGACTCKSNCVCTFERTTLNHEPVLSPEPPMALNQLLPAEPCRERNRLAARKGVDAAPVRLYADRPPPALLAGAPGSADAEAKARLVSARGKLPATDAEALDRINAKLEGGKPLRLDQVHLVYLEAANTNFVGDRHLFLGVSTLKNFAAEAEAGFAFMNSHRTGGLSAPSELPYGRTFAGRFETYEQPDGSRFSRSLVGVYMLRGQRPNGAAGPSTDDFHAGIQAGTIFDVSMGFHGGDAVCDVCGGDLSGDCPHVPGTTLAMTADQVSAQESRGVPGGAASYTIEDSHAREVSAVYDGAVPGAGFKKALHLSRAGRLPAAALDQARRAYAPLARAGDFAPAPAHAPNVPGPRARPAPPTRNPKGTPLARLDLDTAVRFWLAAGQPESFDLSAFQAAAADPQPQPAPPQPQPQPAPAPQPEPVPAGEAVMRDQLQRLSEQLQRESAERERERRQSFEAQIAMQVDHWVDRQLSPDVRTAVPAEKAPLTNVLLQLARDDAASPAKVAYFQDGAAKVGSRLEAFQALWSLRGAARLQRRARGRIPGRGRRPRRGPPGPREPGRHQANARVPPGRRVGRRALRRAERQALSRPRRAATRPGPPHPARSLTQMDYGRYVIGNTGVPIEVAADGAPEWQPIGISVDWTTVTAVGSDTTLSPEGLTVKSGQKYLRYGQVMCKITGQPVNTVTLSGSPSAGTFTLYVVRPDNGAVMVTAAIAYNATATAVKNAITALNVGGYPVAVTGSAGGPYTVTTPLGISVAVVERHGRRRRLRRRDRERQLRLVRAVRHGRQ
jgi:hypothetical protein